MSAMDGTAADRYRILEPAAPLRVPTGGAGVAGTSAGINIEPGSDDDGWIVPHPVQLQDGTMLQLYKDGEALHAAYDAIRAARKRICLQVYIFHSDSTGRAFAELLASRAREGLSVYVIYDAFGSMGSDAVMFERMAAAGVRLAAFHPIKPWECRYSWRPFNRDHRKLLIIDGEVAFVTGAGITDDFADPDYPQRSWRENAVRVVGPVVQDWQQLFLRVWTQNAALPAGGSPVPEAGAGEGMLGRVVSNRRLGQQEIRRSFLNRVQGAASRAWFSTAYFVPSRNVLRALQRAAARGVDVRLLLPGPYTDHPAVRHAGRRFYSRLLRHGVRIYEYQPRFLHAKSVLCDSWTSIGSSNLDRWNLRWNLEANQEVDDAAFAVEVQVMFERDFADSLEIRYPEWRRRGLRERLREHLWGRVDMLLESLGRVRGIR